MNMSPVFAGIFLALIGLFILAIRLFTFENIEEVDKAHLKNYKVDRFLASLLSALFMSTGVVLIIVFNNKYPLSLKWIIHDMIIMKPYFGLILIFTGAISIFFRDEILKDRRKEGVKSLANNSKNRFIILLLGIILLISGFLLILIKLV